jgi:S1-C subfamily serine protease
LSTVNVTGKAALGVSVQTNFGPRLPSITIWFRVQESGLSLPAAAQRRPESKRATIITKLGDTEIRSNSDLIAAKKAYKAGDTTTITVLPATW